MLLSSFDFELPQTSIAQTPATPRDAAKLLHVTESLSDYRVSHLPNLLKEGDLLVFNNTRVIPARLIGRRGQAKIEVMLHKKCDNGNWLAFAKPAKRLRIGDIFEVAEGFSAEVMAKNEGEVTLTFNLTGDTFYEALQRHGHIPLPPYISRKERPSNEDNERYQTVYAASAGAVAAPTAGLHFTDTLLAELEKKGIETAFVTLHVGAGTFLPVKTENVHEHKMHAEYYEVNADTAQKINHVREQGGRVVAVGTTSLRVLESVADHNGQMQPCCGETDIFITPGYRFKIVDVLMTNFHLPKSTLFMLVCAFAGMERMKAAYQHAIDSGYRFYSYGDSSLLFKVEEND